jgi:hypothetical protein
MPFPSNLPSPFPQPGLLAAPAKGLHRAAGALPPAVVPTVPAGRALPRRVGGTTTSGEQH